MMICDSGHPLVCSELEKKMVKFYLLSTLPFIYILQNNAKHKCELHMAGYFKFSSSHMKSVKRDRFLEKKIMQLYCPLYLVLYSLTLKG